ncbi:MAG TPA: phosphotransferase [Steroidobacteraceae bacterium]|nr:phosphotransferase [Steroidobacteraceae bacterium]
MRPDELERVAARHVPGRGKLDIHRLGKGLVNETYRVLRDGAAYALRVAAANPHDLGVDRVWEARVLDCAFAADLAPLFEYRDPPRGILISRWVEGRAWSPADVRLESNISRLAALLQRIHALPMPAPARVVSPMRWIEYYSAAAGESAAREGGTGAESCAGAGAALRSAAMSRLAALAALPGVDPVVCHSDLHTLNLIDRGRSLILLDWEYAHASDPLWDLASWSANNDLEDEFKHELLANYLERPPTRDEILRLLLLEWLYDYVCLLWSEVYLNLQRVGGHGAAPDDDAPGGVLARARLLAARLTSK